MAVVDNAVYVDGRRHIEPPSLEETYELLRKQKGTGWIGLYRSDASEVRLVASTRPRRILIPGHLTSVASPVRIRVTIG